MHGDEILFLLIVPMMCFSGIVIFAIHRGTEVMKAKARTDHPIEVQQLRDTVHRLEQRVQSLEQVVTGAEYQAAQRVAKALEERTPPEVGRSASIESSGSERATAR